jgi:hypothetical protein
VAISAAWFADSSWTVSVQTDLVFRFVR